MKKLIQLVIIGTILSTMLAGCIIVPRGHGGGYYDRGDRYERYR